jgi:GDP-L-fucose synthase
MNELARIFVADPGEMIGAALSRALRKAGLGKSILAAESLDLACAASVHRFFAEQRPTHVFLEAGKKGGILANQRFPADLMLDNLLIATNVLNAAFRHGTEKVLYLASACIYPRDCPQPMQERMLLTGPLEPTNEAYSVSKIAGLKLCQAIRRQYGRNFIAAVPTNIFGPQDDFHLDNAHVVGALMNRIHRAQCEGQPEVVVWGSGSPRREFLYSDNLADACLFLMNHYMEEAPINIGFGTDLTIRDLAEAIKQVVGYAGALHFDTSKPDGMPLKSLDCSLLTKLGWQPSIPFLEGLRRTYQWYVEFSAD